MSKKLLSPANLLNNVRIRTKIGGGFFIVGAVLAISVLTTIWQVRQTTEISDRVIDARVPTSRNSLSMLNGINHSLAALRGYMILGKDKFKNERSDAWEQEIHPSLDQLKELSKGWTNPANVKRLKGIEESLIKLEKAQKQIEDISQTDENQPALKLLTVDAAPQAAIMSTKITQIIDIEQTLDSTPERKALLGMMADVRGTNGLALAAIRAFLLTGEDKYKAQYDTLWTKNTKRFGDLKDNRQLLNNEQAMAFDKFSEARQRYTLLPAQMFKIRSSQEWNIANSWLGTRAAPVAFSIKNDLDLMAANQKVLLEDDAARMSSNVETLEYLEWALLGFGLLLCTGIGYFITVTVTKPIHQAEVAMGKIAKGDLTVRLDTKGNDELGDLARAINTTIHSLDTALHGVMKHSSAVTKTVGWIEQSALELSSRTDQQAAALEETSATLEEISTTTRSNSENASEAASFSDKAKNLAVSGNESVSSAIGQMDEIMESSNKIVEIVAMVNEIAFQTNLLALNAAVEAARAGDEGRGFAVVATEVRSLAQRSSDAAKQIKNLIEDSVTKVKIGQSLANESGSKLGEIQTSVDSLAGLVDSLSSSSSEQALAVDEINRAISQMDQVTQGNAQMVRESANSATTLFTQTESLRQAISAFKLSDTEDMQSERPAKPNSRVANPELDGDVFSSDSRLSTKANTSIDSAAILN